MDKLKVCPFCGGNAEVAKVHYEYPKLDLYWVRCTCCSAEIKNPAATKKEAVSRWERRTFESRVEPAVETPPLTMRDYLNVLNIHEFLTLIHDILLDWDGCRTANSMGLLLNEIQSYITYYLNTVMNSDK